MPRVLVARVLAVVLPLLILGAAIGAVAGLEPPGADAEELERAGRTMNGEVFKRKVRFAIARHLAESERRVLILGNSLAHANVDPAEVARQVQVRRPKVGVIAIPNSISSHWYAILKNSVFGRGHRPELVVVVSSLQAMLMVEPYSEASRRDLLVHLAPVEPVLDRYVARGPRWLERWSSQRLLWREAALDALRDRSVGLLFRGDPERAMLRVFREDRMLQAPGGAGRVVADVASDGDAREAVVPRVRDSLLAELAALAEAHGATLVFVRPPTAPGTPPVLRDVVADGIAEQVAALLAARGHRLVDTSEDPIPADWFANHRHLTAEGATQFTRRIGPELREVWDRAKRPRRP